MPKVSTKSKTGKVRLSGSHYVGAYSIGEPIKRVGKFSEEVPIDQITLKVMQTNRAKKAPKPTLPKMPWD